MKVSKRSESQMQFRLRTLFILMAIGPPVIGFWPHIKRQVTTRITQITTSDLAVIAAASTLVAMRVRLHFSPAVESENGVEDQAGTQVPYSRAGGPTSQDMGP